jgi:hypothetical protein
LIFNGLHDVTSQKTEHFIISAVKTSNATNVFYYQSTINNVSLWEGELNIETGTTNIV